MLRLRLYCPTRIWPGLRRGGGVDWPPSPWRLVGALLEGAEQLDRDGCAEARRVLRRLAMTDPPVLWLPPWHEQTLPDTWVPASDIPSLGPAAAVRRQHNPSLTTPGLPSTVSKGLAPQSRVELAAPELFLDVKLPLDPQAVAALARAARRVGYLARSTHYAQLGVLTHTDGGGWVDHTAGHADVDVALTGPGTWHDRYLPDPNGAWTARCWDAGAVDTMDQDYDAMRRGLPGVENDQKGTRVHYARIPGVTGGWVPLRLARATHDTASVMRLASSVRPEGAARELPVLRGGRLVGLLVDGQQHVLAVHQARPGWWADGTPPGWRRPLGSGQRWSTVSPVAHVANERAARAALTAELGGDLRLNRAGVCPSRPELGLWHCHWSPREPVTGPVRAGLALDDGYGLFAPDSAQEDQ